MPTWAEGHVVAGKYCLQSRLGRGGMGEVWRADHLVLHAPVAIKFINPGLSGSQEITARFMREARAAAVLRSVHVVQILDYGVDQRTPFMVLEYLEGESLQARLKRGPLSPLETAHVINHISRAIARAHEVGIVHRDLKPANVYLVPTGDEIVAKVLDFGIAKMRGRDSSVGRPTRTGEVIGSPNYMSPEQAEGSLSVDHRTDLWALGVIAFECLTGRKPFDSKDFGELLLQIVAHPIPRPSDIAHVPPGFDAWFDRSVRRDPAERFQSAKDAADTLRMVCGAPTTAASTSQVDPVPAPALPAAPASVPGLQHTVPMRPSKPLLPILLGMALLMTTALGIGIILLVLSGRGARDSSASASTPASAGPPSTAPTTAQAEQSVPATASGPKPVPAASSAPAPATAKAPAEIKTPHTPPKPSAKASASAAATAAKPSTPPPGTVRPEDLL